MMEFDPVDPARALMQVMKIDLDLLSKKDLLDISHFIFYNECGLAHDVLVYMMREGEYTPSSEALKLIKLSSEMLGIEYPKLSVE
jgi:hypothetical protein